MAKIKLVVFDLAGTTVFDKQDVQRTLQNTLKNYNLTISIEEAARVMGIPKPVAIRQLLEDRQMQSDDALVNRIHDEFVASMIRFYETDPEVSEMPGASGIFRQLQQAGVKVGIDTGFDRPITDALLDRLCWAKSKLVHVVVTSDEVPRGRPFPDMIFRAMDLTAIRNAAEVAKVGDTESDLKEGDAAGCGLVIGVTTGAYSRESLLEFPHTHIADDLKEVFEIIIKHV